MFFDVFHVLDRRMLALVPLRPWNDPIGRKIRIVHGIHEVSKQCVAAMRHGIKLAIPRRKILPRSLEDRDDGFEGGRFCGAKSFLNRILPAQ